MTVYGWTNDCISANIHPNFSMGTRGGGHSCPNLILVMEMARAWTIWAWLCVVYTARGVLCPEFTIHAANPDGALRVETISACVLGVDSTAGTLATDGAA